SSRPQRNPRRWRLPPYHSQSQRPPSKQESCECLQRVDPWNYLPSHGVVKRPNDTVQAPGPRAELECPEEPKSRPPSATAPGSFRSLWTHVPPVQALASTI